MRGLDDWITGTNACTYCGYPGPCDCAADYEEYQDEIEPLDGDSFDDAQAANDDRI